MSGARLKEQALLVGPRRALVGILTPPADGAPPRDSTVVILNSGIIHRVGANRLHVELARDLARAGFRVLRFDLSGIGDSPSRQASGASILDTVMADIREAVDHVAGKDGRVALFGLCSGAAHALLYAPQDERVTGLILLDLWIPRTRRYHVRRTWKRLTGRRGWVNLLTGRHPLLKRVTRALRDRLSAPHPGLPTSNGAEPSDDAWNDAQASGAQAKAMFTAAFRPIISRKVPVLAVFTAGLEDQHNYATQMFDAFSDIAFGDRVQLEWFPESDHTFSSFDHRRRLRELVVTWMSDASPTNVAEHRPSSPAVLV